MIRIFLGCVLESAAEDYLATVAVAKKIRHRLGRDGWDLLARSHGPKTSLQ